MKDLGDILDTDERLLWEGAPTRRLFLFQPLDLFFMPFVLLWTSWVGLLISQTGPGTFGILRVFLAVGAWGLVGRFLWDAWRRRGTTYALTDRRAIILHIRPSHVLPERPLRCAMPITLTDADRGNVTFGKKGSVISQMAGLSFWTGGDGSFTFRRIEDPASVSHLAREAIRGLRRDTDPSGLRNA